LLNLVAAGVVVDVAVDKLVDKRSVAAVAVVDNTKKRNSKITDLKCIQTIKLKYL